jgi:cytochrome c oxidase subunit I+III
LIVAIAFTCLLFSYFYIRVESPTWPTDGIANPGLLWPAVSSLLLLLSGGAMRWALRGIEAARQGQLRLGLAAVFGLGVVALGLLINDFRQVPFTIGTNAYGSLYYTINGFIFALVIAGLLQNIYTQIWAWQGRYSADEHVAINVTGTWWWAAIVFWLIAMGVVYVGPYVI